MLSGNTGYTCSWKLNCHGIKFLNAVIFSIVGLKQIAVIVLELFVAQLKLCIVISGDI